MKYSVRAGESEKGIGPTDTIIENILGSCFNQ